MSFQESIGSGEKTADAVIVAEKCWITAIEVITNGSADARVILYDNASAASGDVIWESTVVGADGYGGKNWFFPRVCNHGIYADVNGTGATYIIEYILTPER